MWKASKLVSSDVQFSWTFSILYNQCICTYKIFIVICQCICTYLLFPFSLMHLCTLELKQILHVCVCVCTPLMKMCTQVASLTLLTCVLGQGCLKFEKAVCSEGTGKESERNTHTHSHDSNHGAAVAERSSCTQMLLSSSSQDEAVLRVLCLWSPLAVLPGPLQPFFIWAAVLGQVPLRLMLKWQFMCR